MSVKVFFSLCSWRELKRRTIELRSSADASQLRRCGAAPPCSARRRGKRRENSVPRATPQPPPHPPGGKLNVPSQFQGLIPGGQLRTARVHTPGVQTRQVQADPVLGLKVQGSGFTLTCGQNTRRGLRHTCRRAPPDAPTRLRPVRGSSATPWRSSWPPMPLRYRRACSMTPSPPHWGRGATDGRLSGAADARAATRSRSSASAVGGGRRCPSARPPRREDRFRLPL